MKQLQVTVPKKFKEDVKEALEDYSSDISASEVEKKDEKAVEFDLSLESSDIDELTAELKGMKDLESGELSIRVLEQDSLIRKGQKTTGSQTSLSQEELYSKAQESAGFSKPQWGLIGLASVISSYGIASNNLIAIIGAMMLAPVLSPFISGALALNVGDRSLLVESLKNGLKSVLAVIAISFVVVQPFQIFSTPALELVSAPTVMSVLLSISVGAAAALSFATGLRDQIAGVAVAIALVPPLSAVGLGLKMQSLNLAVSSFGVASLNAVSILLSGFLCFKLLGLTPSTYYRQKQAEKMHYLLPVSIAIFTLVAAPILYTSFQSYQDEQLDRKIVSQSENFLGEKLVKSEVESGQATFYIAGEFNRSELESELPPEAEFRMIQLGTG